MRPRVITVKPNQTAHEAAKIMKKEDVGSVIVCQGDKPVGIVTREDITNKIAAKDLQASKVSVKNIMSSPVVTIDADADLNEAAKLMTKKGFERLPVVRLNRLVGMLSVREVLKVAPPLLEIMKERLEEPELQLGEETNEGACELCGNYSEELHQISDRWVCESCKEEAEEV